MSSFTSGSFLQNQRLHIYIKYPLSFWKVWRYIKNLEQVELIENINRNNRKLLDPESSVTSQEAISKSLLFRPGISPEASKAAGEERKAGTAMGGAHASSTPPTSLPPPLLPDS